ncbi:hypothetical protein ACWGS9_10175 [Bradyrhizobium sp. Arg314]
MKIEPSSSIAAKSFVGVDDPGAKHVAAKSLHRRHVGDQQVDAQSLRLRAAEIPRPSSTVSWFASITMVIVSLARS